MAFQARWRELKKAGWQSKRPWGLSVDFMYVKPGKTKKDIRGEDIFVGEEELMKYLDKIDIGKEFIYIGFYSNYSNGVISPAALQAEENARDGYSNTARSGSSAVVRETTVVEYAEESSGASDVESEPDSNVEHTEHDEESRGRLQNDERLAGEDVNHVADDEDPSKYSRFESDAENDDGDNEEQTVDTVDAEDMKLPHPPELSFDHRLVSTIAGLENITSGVVPDAFLKEFGEKGWSDLDTNTPYNYLQEQYEPRSRDAMYEDYPRLYSGEAGPTARALAAASTPSGAFFYFIQPDLWDLGLPRVRRFTLSCPNPCHSH
ncbi:unnamed protein product [Phytophthora fragariaefolia]|uniref:Unnamed protein product n=1 Tax=Phytophthora fragariaefolia TaxID=1490495 RepID=A0A9W6XBT4_9STRA|nr:unnamed protein product [Phytophthora fragariaefolia]